MNDILLLPFGVGTHVVGPLPDFWASGNPVGLGNGIFGTGLGEPRASQLGWVYLGLSTFFLTGRFMLEKRAFSTENLVFPCIFCDFLSISRISMHVLDTKNLGFSGLRAQRVDGIVRKIPDGPIYDGKTSIFD